MNWTVMLVGVALGVLLTLPVAAWWSRRTERRVRRFEQRARAAERLAELGTLTGGLAHEIKNPLSTINLNAQLIHEDLADLQAMTTDHACEEKVGRVQRRLDALSRETRRLRDILEDFLRFAGRVKLDLVPTDINSLLDELADFFAPQAEAAQVQLRRQLAASPATVPADEALLKQALLNLLINATQAMATAREQKQPHGGADELLIRTEQGRAPDRDELLIHITDTGPGMPPNILEKVFQPYFSTKRGGTGLGLPTARRIIEEHGGSITAHSHPGKGTDFTICLPATVEEPPAEA